MRICISNSRLTCMKFADQIVNVLHVYLTCLSILLLQVEVEHFSSKLSIFFFILSPLIHYSRVFFKNQTIQFRIGMLQAFNDLTCCEKKFKLNKVELFLPTKWTAIVWILQFQTMKIIYTLDFWPKCIKMYLPVTRTRLSCKINISS